jgi:hypothetical protein
MRTRRSLAIMSAVEGWVLLVYQGACSRRAAMSASLWPAVAYQRVVRVWQARVKGTVRGDRVGFSVAGVPDAEDLFGVFVRDLDRGTWPHSVR